MTRERWEQILFAHVPDEVVQDMLNAYVLELEAENAELRELVRDMNVSHTKMCTQRGTCAGCRFYEWGVVCPYIELQDRAYKLGVEVKR